MKKVKKEYFKIWSEVEKITEYDNGEETYEDMEMPVGIAYRETVEEAAQLQEELHVTYYNLTERRF